MSGDHGSPHSSVRRASGDELCDLPPGNGLCLQLAPFRLEHIEDYEYGGHHPVHLGDKLGDDGRYIVIHKLGYGGFANVWLCKDSLEPLPTYVALKILMAENSTSECPEMQQMNPEDSNDAECAKSETRGICLPLNKFVINGPNGTHFCFVYPLLGPKTSLGLYISSDDPDRVLRDACFKVFQAVAFLHAHGLCHGDLTPSNVLQRIVGLDSLSEEEVLSILGKPSLNKVLDAETREDHRQPSAPHYLVYPIAWHTVDSKHISREPSIIDFGEFFPADSPPEDLGIPGPYRSPELILESKAGYGSDLWALACTAFEIRTGRKLINVFDDDDDAYLDEMVRILGPMPEPWWSTTWTERRSHFKDELNEAGKAVPLVEEEPYVPPEGVRSSVHPSIVEDARSILDMLAPGVWYMSEDAGRDECETHREIRLREKQLFADLLGKLMVFKPQDRMSAKEALEHDWFKM